MTTENNTKVRLTQYEDGEVLLNGNIAAIISLAEN